MHEKVNKKFAVEFDFVKKNKVPQSPFGRGQNIKKEAASTAPYGPY